MFASDLDGTQWAIIIAAVGTQITLIVAALGTRSRTKTIVTEQATQRVAIDDVHTLVNANNDANVARTDQLEQSIQDAGNDVPPRPPKVEP